MTPAHPMTPQPWQGFVWIVGGRTVRAAIGLFVGVWVARYLGPADFGLLNSALAVALMLSALSGLGLDSLVRQELVREPQKSGDILGTCVTLRLASGALLYVGLICAALRQSPELRALWLVCGLMLVTHVPMCLDFWYQSRLDLRYSTIGQNIAFAISAALRAGLILIGGPVLWFAGAIVFEGPISGAFLYSGYVRGTPKDRRWGWDWARAQRWLRTCWPLLASNLLAVAFTQLNQVILVVYSNAPVEAGRYAAASRVFELGSFVITAFVTTQVPSITRARDLHHGQGAQVLRRSLAQAAAIAWTIGLGAAVTAPWLTALLFGSEYRGTEASMRLVALALVPLGSGLIRHEWWVGAERTHRLLIAYVAGAAVNLLVAVWLIPRWGAAGAATAMLTGLCTTHLGGSFFWSDAREFGRWQLNALLLRPLWTSLKRSQPEP